MNAIIDAAIAHARTVLAALVLILIAGTYTYISIPKEADPDINIPLVYVNVVHEGISPEDAENLLIKPLEQEMTGIEGLKELRSTAFQGGANVILEFDAGFDVDRALADVREKVDIAKPDLPLDAEEPTVEEVNFSLFPVLVVSLSGKVPERALLRLARQLQDRIEAISSVLKAEIAGDRDQLMEIVIDPLALESYNLDARAIIDAVNKSNLVIAAGDLDTGKGRFAVKLPGLFERADDILAMPLKVDGDAAVTIGDVARLRYTFKDPESFARTNGRPSIALQVTKRSGENILETIEEVRATVADTSKDWPANVRVSYSQDKSSNIRQMLSDLQSNVVSAIILVMVVVVAALGLRSAGLVGLAIPGSFLTAILVLYALGFTINIVVLFSLILAVGMLVDGAIVMTEYADRKMIEGFHRREAYALAAKRMAWPIIASTATTLAAFLPLMFWPGVVGEFMKFLPITLVATLTASLAMALIFVPTLGSVVGKTAGSVDPQTMRALAANKQGNVKELRGFTGFYIRVLDRALHHPGKILIVALTALVGVQVSYAMFGRGVEFFPDVEPEFVALQIHARGNLSIEERDELVGQVEGRVLALQREHGEFHQIFAQSFIQPRQNDSAEDLIGEIQVEFTDWFLRRPASEIISEIRERTADLAGIVVEPRKEEAGPPVGKPVQVQVSSQAPALIEPSARLVAETMRELGGFVDIDDGRPIPGIEWQLQVDRTQAAKFGADISLIGSYVRTITNGLKLGEYRPDDADEEIDIVVRLPLEDRTLSQLDSIRIQTDMGMVPISNFVKREARRKVSYLHRVDGLREMTVEADVGIDPATGEPLLVDSKVRELRAALDEAGVDPRVNITFKGEDEEQQKAQAFLGKAFMVALFLMAIILVTQFNSFYSALLILSAVVMSTLGVMIGLMVTGQPFGIVMSGIGVIALAGIVVNNNIVLIDTFDRLKKEAGSVREAILKTGAQRLRPVLLTTITTILGLMPMVLGVNVDVFNRLLQVGAPSMQWWAQLSSAIVFGLSFATLLTLVVTPCSLMLRGDAAAWLEKRRARRAATQLSHDTGGAEGPEMKSAAE